LEISRSSTKVPLCGTFAFMSLQINTHPVHISLEAAALRKVNSMNGEMSNAIMKALEKTPAGRIRKEFAEEMAKELVWSEVGVQVVLDYPRNGRKIIEEGSLVMVANPDEDADTP